MKNKLGVIITDETLEGALDSLETIHELGFKAFFTAVYSKEFCQKLKVRADELGLEYEFIHATWSGINELWTSKEIPQIVFDLKEQIDLCFSAGVSKLVVHLSSGNDAPFVSDLGFQRLDDLVLYAKGKNVRLVFENQRKLFSLACVLERYKDDIGYCYDSGHENCFTQNIKFLDFWADKVTCVHLHDNCGEKDKDEHLLPFDGTVNFNYVIKNLKQANFSGSIMLEVFNKTYPQMEKKEFFKLAYDRAKKLSQLK